MHRSYYFVRHARAIYQDRGFRPADHPAGTDWPLSPLGPAQARALAPWLLRSGVETVVSSRLLRARQTADHIADQGGLARSGVWPELNEISPQRLLLPEARGGPVVTRLGPGVEWWLAVRMARAMRRHLAGGSPAPFHLEPVHTRIRTVLDRLDALDTPRVAVVSHGYWILLASLGLDGPIRPRWIENCSVTRVDADGRGRYRLTTFAQRVTP